MQDGDPPCAVKTYMRLISDPSAAPVDKTSIPESDLKDYYEDLEADSIDNWTRTKMVAMKLINQKINFLTFDDWAIRYNEIFAPAVPMGND